VATSEELRSALSRNVRQWRTARGWSLDELATRSGVSRAMIVQVEAAKTNASLGTICELADALGVPVPSLIETTKESRVQIVSADETSVIWSDANGGFARLLCGTATRQKAELWSWKLGAGSEHASKAHPRGTREIIWVMTGALTVRLGDEEFTIGAGDSIIFEADLAHTYHNARRTACTFGMIVQLPPI
jgi:transcriptional regulator with XRE-family HTH domain